MGGELVGGKLVGGKLMDRLSRGANECMDENNWNLRLKKQTSFKILPHPARTDADVLSKQNKYK